MSQKNKHKKNKPKTLKEQKLNKKRAKKEQKANKLKTRQKASENREVHKKFKTKFQGK